MAKKFFSVMILAAIIFFCGQNNFAQAKDIYVGTYNSGYEAYLMTETIRTNDSEMYCKIKAVYGGDIIFVNYKFSFGRGIYYENSQGFSGKCDEYKTPIEWKIVDVAQKYW